MTARSKPGNKQPSPSPSTNPNGELIIGLDPASTRVGFAVLMSDWQLAAFGVLSVPAKLEPIRRIAALAQEVERLVSESHTRDLYVAVEVTTGKVGQRHGQGGGAGLAVYGMAVGALFWAVSTSIPMARIVAVRENVWTNRKPKAQRLELIALQFGIYGGFRADGRDPGGDAGDAIGIACWLRQHLDLVNASDGQLGFDSVQGCTLEVDKPAHVEAMCNLSRGRK